MSQSVKNNITVEINNIAFSYGKRSIFEDFSLIIPKGISLGLLGGNGSGKTTIMKLISGLEKAKKGDINLKKLKLLIAQSICLAI